MKIIELFEHLNIPYLTEGSKHCRPGWANTSCPYCVGNPGHHLGFELDREFFRCWRCGWHPIAETLSKLSGMPQQDIKILIRQFGGKSKYRKTIIDPVRMQAFKLPSGTSDLTQAQRKYLIGRRFNPDYLIREWDLKGTGPGSMLGKAEYKHRIIAPIYWDGKMVTFQGRSTSEKNQPKYKACPKERELIHHKHILYGKQECWGDTGVIVEGITDVWRLGTRAAAVFGIEYKLKQVQIIAKTFKRVVIIFDGGETQAKVQARKLAGDLRMYGLEVIIENIEDDPGGMNQDDANHLMRNIT